MPQALRSKPHDVFGSRIAALQQLGIDGEAVKSVVGRSTVFLTTKGAPQEQLAFLKEDLGFTTDQVGSCAGAFLRQRLALFGQQRQCGIGLLLAQMRHIPLPYQSGCCIPIWFALPN